MIVCSCNIITRRDIEAVIERILANDPYAVLTPNLIYHRLGRRGRCCGCFPQVTDILVEHATAVRERMERGEVAETLSTDDAHANVPWAQVPPRARAS